MNLFVGIIIVLVSVFSLITNRPKINFFIIIFTFMNQNFAFDFIGNVKVFHLISFLYLPITLRYLTSSKNQHNLKSLKPFLWLVILLFFVTFYFSVISPWQNPYDYQRVWSQRALGRAIVSFTRLILELNLIILLIYWINNKKISSITLVRMISFSLIITVLIAIVDFILAKQLSSLLFPSNFRFIEGRVTGFNGEPRGFGRICSFSVMFLVSAANSFKYKIKTVAIISGAVGIVLSLSASTIIITMVWLFIFLLTHRKFKYILTTLFILTVSTVVFLKTPFFGEQTKYKILLVLTGENELSNSSESIYVGEPEIFKRFEVFDRAALNFIYKNPEYSIFGVGLNLISIPSSDYLNAYHSSIYGDRIDSVPHTMLVNIISSGGILALIILLVLYISVRKHLIYKQLREFHLLNFITNFLVYTSFFYLFIGLTLGLNNKLIIDNDEKTQARIS